MLRGAIIGKRFQWTVRYATQDEYTKPRKLQNQRNVCTH